MMFFKKPVDTLPETLQTLDPSVFFHTRMDAHRVLPEGWRAAFSTEDRRDINKTDFVQDTNRIKLYRFGVLIFHMADLRHLVPYPETYSVIKAPKDIHTRNAIAQMLRQIESLSHDA